MNIFGNDIDFRVSILPSTLGEKIVLRILDKSAGLLDINLLGFESDTADRIKGDATSSFGMILACGPTGCGKTTTLYSILRHIYSPEKNIITVEDPIEYQIEGINQVNVNYEVELTFPAALRSILRQDPDIIMVGEIRDFDTVDIAIKAALTGHLVLSTLHTTTACGSITRLINMGVEPFLLSSTLIGVLAQRLVRRLCPKCRETNNLDDAARVKYKIKNDAVVYKPRGCKFCYQTGYKGRVALIEYLHMDSSLRRLVGEDSDEHTIKREAISNGMRTLRSDGILKVEKGLTSLEEVVRATVGDES
jgi:type II secretory ATPase GspE/PulE/Tfp pilus assembly ATPase PilB-like protein